MLVNKSADQKAECNLNLKGISETATATLLTGDGVDAYNDIDMPNRVVPKTIGIMLTNGKVTVPAHTVMILKVQVM